MDRQEVMWLVHYLDDFLPRDLPTCSINMEIMTTACREASLPIEPTKSVGPMSFLGVELDSNEDVIRLPEDKLCDLKTHLQVWHKRKACKKQELLSLLGLLNHARKIVRAGRSFLCRLIDESTKANHLKNFCSFEWGGKIWHRMVVSICWNMEWGIYALCSGRPNSNSHCDFRHFGVLGVWCSLQPGVVSPSLEQ